MERFIITYQKIHNSKTSHTNKNGTIFNRLPNDGEEDVSKISGSWASQLCGEGVPLQFSRSNNMFNLSFFINF